MPEGVREVLLRRLARLSEACRTTLAHAAVLGREFDFTTLRAMADGDEDEVIVALEEALDARLVVEAPGGYAFTHALVRETLYGTLSVPRRQRMHARAAAAIPDGVPTLAALALHHRLAGPAGDPAAAIDCSLRAGGRARELFAWEDAAAHWDGALAVMERIGADAAARARLLVALAELMAVTGDLGRQIAYLERALALYIELRDDERAAQTHSRLGQAHSLIDSIYADHLDIRRAFRHFDAARTVLERGPARKARGHLETGHLDRSDLRPADPARDRGGVARDRDRRAARRRGAVGGRHRGLRLAPDHRRRPARGLRRPGARVRLRRRRPAPVPGLDGLEHPRARWRGRSATRTRASGSSSAR